MRTSLQILFVLLIALCSSLVAAAASLTPGQSPVRAMGRSAVFVPQDAVSPEASPGLVDQTAWQHWKGLHPSSRAYFDRRTGRPALLETSEPWIPGAGNQLTWQDFGFDDPADSAAVLQSLESQARDFVRTYSDLLGVNEWELVLDEAASQAGLPYEIDGRTRYRLWNVVFRWQPHGMEVRGAQVFFRINSGNLIHVGTVHVGDSERIPREQSARVSEEAARRTLLDHLGAHASSATFPAGARLQVLATSPEAGRGQPRWTGVPGHGIVYRLAWIFHPVIEHDPGHWEGAVDARTGKILYLLDQRVHGRIEGEVLTYDASDDRVETEVNFSLSDYSPGLYANSQGIFGSASSPVSSLIGERVEICDKCDPDQETQCSPIDVTTTYTDPLLGPVLDFGGDHSGTLEQCPTSFADPSHASAGNTPAARTAYYHATRAKLLFDKYYPPASGVHQRARILTNDFRIVCGGFYSPLSSPVLDAGSVFLEKPRIVSLSRDGQTLYKKCNNGGHSPSLVVHELGHWFDDRDGSAIGNYGGSSEAFGDITSALYFADSCIARSFDPLVSTDQSFNNPPGVSDCGEGNYACSSGCDGVREIDWRNHAGATPHTPLNFNVNCPSAGGSYLGPCGNQAHCESAPASEAMWDLVLEIDAMGEIGLNVARELFFSRGSSSQMFQCSSEGGAIGTSLYHGLRAADDCDGDPSDGTLHGAAIFAALDRHGIAVGSSTDAPNQNDTDTPTADFTFSCSDGTCDFDASSSSPTGGIVEYEWRFGDGSTATGLTVSHTYVASDTYDVELTIADVCQRTASTTSEVAVTTPFLTMGETGTANIGTSWTTVTLQNSYSNPVVFLQPTNNASSYPVLIPRLVSVSSGSFIARLQSDQSISSTSQSLAYVVLESGLWEVPTSGALLNVGTVTTGATVGLRFADSWEGLSFDESFTSTPIVLSQVQGQNNGSLVSTRHRNITTNGFDLALEGLEDKTSAHGTETLGWLAIDEGVGQWGSRNYNAAKEWNVDSNWNTVTWVPWNVSCASSWWDRPKVASISTFNERHAHVRYGTHDVTDCEQDMRIEEDRSYDSEMSHGNENVSYLVIWGTGSLQARAVAP